MHQGSLPFLDWNVQGGGPVNYTVRYYTRVCKSGGGEMKYGMTIYITQEAAMAPGISGEWPDIIVPPKMKHARLKKLWIPEGDKLIKEIEKLESLQRKSAGR